MNLSDKSESFRHASRRHFLKTTASLAAAGAAAGSLGISRAAHVSVDETIRMAFIGCGNRGRGAVRDALTRKGPIKLVAMADVFQDRIDASLKLLKGIPAIAERIDVPPERQFAGFDGYKKALQCDVDLVMLTTPPGFRPWQYAAAVEAGKHVFMEKPCCVDGPGYRMLVAANQQAKQKKLSVVVGLQRRHQKSYQDGIQRVRDGAVGRMLLIRTYFNMPAGGHSNARCPEGMTEMEWQIRRWGFFTWLSGDHIVEQAVHEIDVANWIADAHPVEANGMGGRQVRTGPGNGQIYDHHFVEYLYPGGVYHYCQARQIGGCWEEVSDNVHGTKGALTIGSGPYGQGGRGYREPDKWLTNNPYEQEHEDLHESIRGGRYVFAGDYGADSSMTAVLGRMATYSGKVVTWEEAVQSQLQLGPDYDQLSLDAPPPVLPGDDGNYPVAIPGVTKAW